MSLLMFTRIKISVNADTADCVEVVTDLSSSGGNGSLWRASRTILLRKRVVGSHLERTLVRSCHEVHPAMPVT